MKLFKSFLFSFFVLSLIFSSNIVLAVNEVKNSTNPDQIPLATVNISDAKITSNDKNVYNISFNLTNKEGLQSGVRYGVKLFSINEKGEPITIVDEKAYPESLSLQPNSTIEKSVTYTAPGVLGGEYILAISSENESGFPFGLVLAGKIKLVSSIKGIEILPETCSTKVEPKTSNTSKNLVIGQNDTIRLTCTAVNSKDSSVSVVPFFETNYRSLYGEAVTTKGGDTKPITFSKLEKKTFSVVLPKAEKSQVFYVKTMLKEGDLSSNAISTTYTVSGVNASIQNLFFDKDYFGRGDTANLSLLWTSNSTSKEELFLGLSILNQNDNKCGKKFTQALNQNTKNIKTDIPFDINRVCINPKAVVTISDNAGNVLDQKIFNIETKSTVPDSNSNRLLIIIIIIIAVIVVILLMFYLKKKKSINSGDTNSTPPQTLLLLLLIAGSFMPISFAKADTFSFGSTGAYAMANVSPTTLSPLGFIPANNEIEVTVTIYPNGVDTATLTFKAANNEGNYLSYNTDVSYPQIKSFTAPNNVGSYYISFQAGVIYQVYNTYVECFTTDTIVRMADGSQKNIQDVEIGDVLKGEKTNNTVLAFHRPIPSEGLLYSFNDGRYFVTAEHPFMTTDGWKSMDPNKTRNENIGIEVTKLNEGDTLITEDGLIKLNSIKSKNKDLNTKLYNFILTGDRTYYADGYLVHNKSNCSESTGHYCSSDSTCINGSLNPSPSGSCSECLIGNPCGLNGEYGFVLSCNPNGGEATCDGGNSTP